jgi:hypothetical protein
MKSIELFIGGNGLRVGTRDHWRKIVILFAISGIILISGCATMGESAGLGTADKTAQLKAGMQYEQVEALLGKPESSKIVKGQQIVRWNLHEYWKGWVAYDMVFDARKKTLVSWSTN